MTQTPAPLRLAIQHNETDTQVFPTFDLFPHRTTIRSGYTPEDLLIYIASVCCRFTDFLHKGRQFDTHFADSIVAEGLITPFADIRKGALVTSKDDTLTGDIILHINADGWRLNDGQSLTPRLYRHLPIFDRHAAYRRERFANPLHDGEKVEESDASRAMLALIEAALPIAPDEMEATRDRLEAAFGRLVRVVDLGYPSGATGTERAGRDVSALWSGLLEAWVIQPDHIHTPHHLVADTLFEEISTSWGIADMRPLAQAAWGASDSEDPKALRGAGQARKGERSGDSMHAELSLRQKIKALDAAIEDASPLGILRPAARKRQEKRRGV